MIPIAESPNHQITKFFFYPSDPFDPFNPCSSVDFPQRPSCPPCSNVSNLNGRDRSTHHHSRGPHEGRHPERSYSCRPERREPCPSRLFTSLWLTFLRSRDVRDTQEALG